VRPCDASVGYGGGIYDPSIPSGNPWTPNERGAYVGTMLGTTFTSSAMPADRWMFFPFTNGSCPTLYGVITTAAQFDDFIAGFKTALMKNGQTQHAVDGLLYGAWGVPNWLLRGAAPQCTKDTECTSDSAAKCSPGGACVPCTDSSSCSVGHSTHTKCSTDGACVAPAAECMTDAGCPTDSAAKCSADGKCVPCTASSSCASHTGKPVCTGGTCVPSTPPTGCTSDAGCPTDAAAKCVVATGTCVACTDDSSCTTHAGHPKCGANGTCVAAAPSRRRLSEWTLIGIIAAAAVVYFGLLAAAIWATIRVRRCKASTPKKWHTTLALMVAGAVVPVLLPGPIALGARCKVAPSPPATPSVATGTSSR